MPAPGSSNRRSLFRPILIVVIALAALTYAFVNIGRFLTKEDPLAKADAIAVLAGTRMDRPLEAADLYKSGYAPRIVLTRQKPEISYAPLARRGIVMPEDAEVARSVFEQLGVPADAVIVPSRIHDNTAEEAQTLRALAAMHGWRTIIVVTQRYHLRRAGFAIRRELRGTGIDVIMRATRYDDANPDRWWTSRADWRWVASETGKLLAYELGLGA